MSDEAETPAPAAPAATGPDRTKWILFWVVTILSIAADQATKIWARDSLPTLGHGTGLHGACVVPEDIIHRLCAGDPQHFVGSFWDWTLSMNPGSAFGLFSSIPLAFARVILSVIGIGALGGMIWMLHKSRRDQRILHWALALVAGGAVGNLIDRTYFSVVTDFISWHIGSFTWPTFNVADIVLVVGVGLMFIDIHKENKRTKKAKPSKEAIEAARAKARAAGLIRD